MRLRLHKREYIPTKALPIQVNSWCRDGAHEEHDHDFVEILVVARGRGRHVTMQGSVELRAGDAFVMRPGVWHGYTDCRKLCAFDCIFGPELLRRELAFIMSDPLLNSLFWRGPMAVKSGGLMKVNLPADARGRCVRELKALHRACSSTELLNPAERLGRLLLILHELASCVDPARGPGKSRSEAAHPAVIAGVRLIEEDLAREWTLPDVSSAVHLDASYFDRVFKKATGLSPMAYLARCRAERAAAMLSSSELTIAQVGECVGWPDPNYFARRFRQHLGVSATEYRRRLSGRQPI